MQKFVKKMVDEKSDIDDKIKKLEAFMLTPTYTELSQKEKKLIREQDDAMNIYSRALGERIELYN